MLRSVDRSSSLSELSPAAQSHGGLLLYEAAPALRQVFVQDSPQAAATAVVGLQARGVVVDCRGKSVRFGFGLNHSRQDVLLALEALRDDAEGLSHMHMQGQ